MNAPENIKELGLPKTTRPAQVKQIAQHDFSFIEAMDELIAARRALSALLNLASGGDNLLNASDLHFLLEPVEVRLESAIDHLKDARAA